MSKKVFKIPYLFPVGYVFISVYDINPSKWFGGTWERFATGRTLVGVDTSQAEFNAVKKTGGEKSVKLEYKHMPKHSHSLSRPFYKFAELTYGLYGEVFKGDKWSDGTQYTSTEGGDQPHNNLPPYITVYMFVRTA